MYAINNRRKGRLIPLMVLIVIKTFHCIVIGIAAQNINNGIIQYQKKISKKYTSRSQQKNLFSSIKRVSSMFLLAIQGIRITSTQQT